MKNWYNFLILIGFLALPFLAGGVGSFFTAPAIEGWYAELIKPAFNPPNWVFAPAWTLLYFLMGLAAWLVWLYGRSRARTRLALSVFGVHLVINSLWSIVFFALEWPLGALVVIVLLWLMILWLIVLFGRLYRPAAYLLLPYLLWVSFAAYLNAAIWYLN